MTSKLTKAIAGYITLNRIYDAVVCNVRIDNVCEVARIIDEQRDAILAEFEDATDRIAILETANIARVF